MLAIALCLFAVGPRSSPRFAGSSDKAGGPWGKQLNKLQPGEGLQECYTINHAFGLSSLSFTSISISLVMEELMDSIGCVGQILLVMLF